MDLTQITAHRLDDIRGVYLRLFLSIKPLRNWYITRSSRLLVSFMVGGTMSLFLASAFPLWVLAMGPVLFGFPHLIASFRYSGMESFRKPFITTTILLSTIVCLFRIAQMKHWVGYGSNNAIELGAVALLFTSLCVFGKARPRYFWTTALLAPLFVLSWRFPFPTVGALILIHNVIAFFYWHRAATNRKDRFVVLTSFVLFLLGNALIFSGLTDALFFRFSPDGESGFLGMKVWEIGSLVLPYTHHYKWLSRATAAYAFGQSIHYFIWLRAIPEQSLPNGTPSSFRQSLHYLRKDLGPRLARLSLLLVVALSSVWLLYEFSWARLVYLSIAAFHGYAEFVGLCLKGRSA